MRILHLALAVLVVLSLTAFALSLRSFAEDLIVEALEDAVGVPVRAESVRISWKRAEADLTGVQFGSPQGFKEPALAYLPVMSLAFFPQALFKGEIHLREARFVVDEIAVEKNPRHWINLLEIQPVRSRFKKNGPADAPAARWPVRIDSTRFSLRRGVFVDYTAGSRPSRRAFELGVAEFALPNVTDLGEVVRRIALIALLRAGWRTLEPDPGRLPLSLMQQGDALVEEVENLFGISKDELEKLLRG